MSSLADAYIRLHYDSSALSAGLASVKSIVTSGLSGIATVGTGVLAAMGFAQLTQGVMGVAGALISTNSEMENYRMSLGALLKDQDAANKLVNDLEQMAKETPFDTAQLIKATQLLKSYGFELEELLPMMKSIGNAAAASPEGMESATMRISLALGQMRAMGKVMGQEMNQLANAGIPAWEMLAQQAGMSIAEVRKKTMSGAITGAEAVKMLMKAFDDRFGGMMATKAKTFDGLMGRVKDVGKILLREIGQPLFEMAKIRLDNLASWLETDAASEWAASLKESVLHAAKLVEHMIQLGTAIASVSMERIVNPLAAAAKALSGEGQAEGTRPGIESIAQSGAALKRQGESLDKTLSDGFTSGPDGTFFDAFQTSQSENQSLIAGFQNNISELERRKQTLQKTWGVYSKLNSGGRHVAGLMRDAANSIKIVDHEIALQKTGMQNAQGRTPLMDASLSDAVASASSSLPGLRQSVQSMMTEIPNAIQGFDFSGAASSLVDGLVGGIAWTGKRAGSGKENKMAALAETLGISVDEMRAGIEKEKKKNELEKAAAALGFDLSSVDKDADRDAQNVQFSALDQFAKQIQTSLSEDSDSRIAKEHKDIAEETKNNTKKSLETMIQINHKLPSPVGFTA